MYKNLKIKSKILVVILLITLISELVLSIVVIGSFGGIKENFNSVSENLTKEISLNSAAALEMQSKNYINNISQKQAEKFNNILNNIKSDTSSMALGMENIYNNSSKFIGFEVLEPQKTKRGDINDVYSASSKIYCIGDKNNEKQKEMKLLSNAELLAKPLYINNYDVDSIYIGTESGLCYNYSVYNDVEKFLPSTRKWYIDAVNIFKEGKEEAVWQSTYIDLNTKKQCITCSKAFSDDKGNVLGVVCIDTFIDTITDEIRSQNMEELGLIFVVDQSKNIIMSSNNISQEQFESFASLLREGKTASNDIRIGNDDYILTSNSINSTGWNIFILSDKNEVLSLIKDLNLHVNSSIEKNTDYINSNLLWFIMSFILLFVAIIILSIVIATITSKKITEPLEKLSNEAERIGKGAFKRKIKIDSKDEIGDLANSFNKMIKDLVIYMRNFRKTTKEKEKINNELKIAKKIQKSMLPCIFPPFPNRSDFNVFATMHPARMVGGDFYDFFLVDDDHLAIVIGDVSGKGIAAALFMVIARTLIKNQAMSGNSPEKVFNLVNKQLTENNDAGMFVTAFMGILNLKTGEFVYSNAGHNKPLLYKSETGFNWIQAKPGFVLGGMDGIKYKLEKIQINPMDMIYLYTDGVTEALDVDNNLFSDERLISTLNKSDVKDLDIKSIILRVENEVKSFSIGKEQADDITMLILKYLGKK